MVPETIAGKIVGGVCSLSGGNVLNISLTSAECLIEQKKLLFLSACNRSSCSCYCIEFQSNLSSKSKSRQTQSTKGEFEQQQAVFNNIIKFVFVFF